jgi:catechol 2,3-dioxygenase
VTSHYGVPAPRYRLPDDTQVGRVRLQVSDLERSVQFYHHVIGLRPLQAGRGHAQLTAGDDRILVELHERAGARPVPPNGRFGLYHFAILLRDRSSLGGFLTHLAGLDVRVASADHLVSEALYLWDPDGLGIEVYADRPRSAWRVNGRELVMATESLDLRGLMRSAQVSWHGMPAGTVMGHVHLHVGSLQRAEAFYHVGLGLDKVVWSFPGALFMSAGGYHHHLGTNTWVEGASPAGDEEARLIDWQLLLPDTAAVDAAAASLRASGYDVSGDGADRTAADDWGTVVRLTAP